MKKLTWVLLVLVATCCHAVAGEHPYQDTIQVFREAGESAAFFEDAYGYAVFPTIGKGGLVVGGAYGEGRVYRGGEHVGRTTVAQVTIGFQLGGQVYSELILFQNDQSLLDFQKGNFALNAQVSAVAAAAGASADAPYAHGVKVITMTKTGLMYEASVGGQKFSYDKL